MKKSAFLARIVSAAILSGAMFGASQVSACDTLYGECIIEVTAPEPDDPWLPTDNGYYDDPGDPTSGSGSGGSGTSNGDYDAAECLRLTGMLPTGCTPELATAGTPRDLFVSYYGLDVLMSGNPPFARDIRRATFDLQSCYANFGVPSNNCEDTFLGDITRAFDNVGYTYSVNTATAALAGTLVAFGAEISQARTGRASVEFVNYLSGSASLGGISVGIGGLLSHLTNIASFNRMWINARAQKVCKYWHDAWAQNDCANH